MLPFFSPPCESCPFFFFFAQVSWAWQWLCCLSLVQTFNGSLFYALLSLQGGGKWSWGERLFEHLQMILGMAALFFSPPFSSELRLSSSFFFLLRFVCPFGFPETRGSALTLSPWAS